MKIRQISDTHNQHQQWVTDLQLLMSLYTVAILRTMVQRKKCLTFSTGSSNYPYPHKIFITGNHDLCLWEAEGIEDLPNNVYFLQDCECEIDGIKFFGLAYNHPETLIPNDVDVLITHEPPIMILDESAGIYWEMHY